MDERAADHLLVERCRSGSEAAFRELVDQYKNMVFGMISRSLSDRSRVEDLAQDVFLRVHRGLGHFRGDARLSTWIGRIVLNVCAGERLPRETSLDGMSPGAPVLPAMIAVDRSFGDLELRDRIRKALRQLSEHAQLLISMHYFGGRGYEDIARDLQLPLGTVKTQLHRAKRDLRVILEGDARVSR